MNAAAKRIAIVGGGLAGLAAASALADRSYSIDLYEAKSRLGGRAGGFVDPVSGETLDHCQHVSMGCCTNLAHFCQTNNAGEFQTSNRLTFIDPQGVRSRFTATNWLPAPLHLAPALLGLKFLTFGERLSIGRAMRALASQPPRYSADEPTIGAWLKANGQSSNAIERYWKVILVSALSETLDRISFSAARQVFVEGFMANRNGWVMETPTQPLDEMYNGQVADSLTNRGVQIYRSQRLKSLQFQPDESIQLTFDESPIPYDLVVLALPRRKRWRCFPMKPNKKQRSPKQIFPRLPLLPCICGLPNQLPNCLMRCLLIARANGCFPRGGKPNLTERLRITTRWLSVRRTP